MINFRYDPATTKIELRDIPLVLPIATFTEFYVTQDLTLTQGSVAVIGFIEVDDSIILTIDGDSVLEII